MIIVFGPARNPRYYINAMEHADAVLQLPDTSSDYYIIIKYRWSRGLDGKLLFKNEYPQFEQAAMFGRPWPSPNGGSTHAPE
jgi:hypothetical protein